jgi:hypothetical protein
MIKDIFDAEQLEWKSNEEDVVWRIATLNDLETMAEENHPGVQKLPEESATILPKMAERTIALLNDWVPVDVHIIQVFILLWMILPAGA